MTKRPDVGRSGMHSIVRILRNTLFIIVLSLALLYVGDHVVLRVRIASGAKGIGSVTVRPVYAVPHKDRKIEYIVGNPQEQSCVHSLFPHMDYAPCWYLQRHTEQRIDM